MNMIIANVLWFTLPLRIEKHQFLKGFLDGRHPVQAFMLNLDSLMAVMPSINAFMTGGFLSILPYHTISIIIAKRKREAVTLRQYLDFDSSVHITLKAIMYHKSTHGARTHINI